MNYPLLVNTIKQILREKFPGESNKARLLSELLDITETSVYQKINGDRQFSLEEVFKIARLLSVSIDTLLGENPPTFSHSMELIYTKQMSGDQRAIYMEETTRSIIEQAAKTGQSKFTGVCKNIPFITYCYFEWIMKFARLKWLYFNNCLQEIMPLTKMRSSGKFTPIKEVYIESVHSFRKLTFILDGNILQNYILNIRFFQKTDYLTIEEIHLLLDDLENLLKTAEDICREGYIQTPGQEIEIFYSDISLYNDIYLVESPVINQGIIFIQGFIPIIHKEPHTFQILRECANSCIRSSNSICGVAILDRNTFFEKQYHHLNEFRNSLSH